MEKKIPAGAEAPQENKMGVLPVGRLLAGMAVPMMISMLVQACYNVVDSVFVAQLSQDALNAVSLAFPLQNLMIAVGGGTAVGINALLSRSLGEKRQDMADRAANTGIFLALCSFVVFALIGLFLSRPFFLAQTKNEVIVEYGTQYATVCLGLSIGVFSQFCFERLLQSTGRTFYAMCTQLTGAVINIVLDPILIFSYFGAPRLEVVGAAVATVAGQIVAAIIAVIINIKRNPDIHIRLREIRWNRVVAGEIYRAYLQVKSGIGVLLVSHTAEAADVQEFAMNRLIHIRPNIYFAVVSTTQKLEYDLYAESSYLLHITDFPSQYEFLAVLPRIEIQKILGYYYRIRTENYCFKGELHDFFELTYVDTGELETEVDGTLYHLKEKDLMIYGPGQFHTQYTDEEHRASYMTILFDMRNLTPVEREVWYDALINRVFHYDQKINTLLKTFVRVQHPLPVYKSFY